MKYQPWILLPLLYGNFTCTMDVNYSFDEEKVAQRIDELSTQIEAIQQKVEQAIKSYQSSILQKQLRKIPNLNRLTSVFAYSYEKRRWKEFNAKMSVYVDFAKKDIRSCILLMAKTPITTNYINTLYQWIRLCFVGILDQLKKQKQCELDAFIKDQPVPTQTLSLANIVEDESSKQKKSEKNESEELDTSDDEIITQKVRAHTRNRKMRQYSNNKSMSFSTLPNPFAEKPKKSKLPDLVEEVH